ncbi:MAG TPA: hypothetical protein VM510_06635, partial [Caulifigura sp.]|nr:hypothetical protein [Caulifigura sp.]
VVAASPEGMAARAADVGFFLDGIIQRFSPKSAMPASCPKAGGGEIAAAGARRDQHGSSYQ